MSKITVKIDKGKNYYFYETEEQLMVCPKCHREYQARKYCLNCSKNGDKTETVLTIKHHMGRITLDLKKYSCDCIFGSFFRWGLYWKKNHPKSRCKHTKWSMRKLPKEGLN